MTTTQWDIVRRMGFGKILKLKVDEIKSVLGHFVVDRLDTKNMVIRLANKRSRLTRIRYENCWSYHVGELG
ncbi:hypothetical protein Hanom_Chr12g01157091 [Helianthus anomalus]